MAGVEHIGVRFAIAQGRLDPARLSPGEGWPALFESFEEMANTQATPTTSTDDNEI